MTSIILSNMYVSKCTPAIPLSCYPAIPLSSYPVIPLSQPFFIVDKFVVAFILILNMFSALEHINL